MGHYKKKIKPIPTELSKKVAVNLNGMVHTRDENKAYVQSLEDFARLTSQVQRGLRSWWTRVTGLVSGRDYILLATQNNKEKYKSKYSIRVDLTQLSLTEDMMKTFDVGVSEEVRKLVEEFNI